MEINEIMLFIHRILKYLFPDSIIRILNTFKVYKLLLLCIFTFIYWISLLNEGRGSPVGRASDLRPEGPGFEARR